MVKHDCQNRHGAESVDVGAVS
ncbi:hypothetical protein AGR13a_Lc90031 [Agrobacterium genomosp. 13 str. CFBP 6927]|uniref:Uncharacterized protein n=1 Tax=Agrobacterium genomosp. 13 str. CFBP 6927 TaxID=1183428 RepID=A0ABM9VNA9_9HYPH|nr:hypothetical protein AGR13a_Lc90031 [Agrobacterium genomosp. 13 str. CFBP 6927]